MSIHSSMTNDERCIKLTKAGQETSLVSAHYVLFITCSYCHPAAAHGVEQDL
jgi:hypothetical protein